MNLLKPVILIALLMFSMQIQAQVQFQPLANKASPVANVQTTDRMIIKYKDKKLLNSTTISTLAQSMQQTLPLVGMSMIRTNTFNANIVKVNISGKKPTLAQMESLAKDLSLQSNIEYAEPDYIMRPLIVPNDTDYATYHWHYQNTPGGANLEGAWDSTTGAVTDVIAVIDTGILPHIELVGKTLPGYDFISDAVIANDGDDDNTSTAGDRDDNASDSGDWCHSGDACYNGSYNTDSSWHGTHVAGTIAAESNNNQGVTGINWQGKILPVRVLGKGGGYSTDIIDGMYWAAGIHVNGVPDNPNPAKVLNLSLGGSGGCLTTYSNAIAAINATGAIIAIAAGNSNEDAADHNPGNCPGVITVAASGRSGSRAGYSNYGTLIDITAPGGDSPNDTAIRSTLDGGATIPANDNAYAQYQGTSMATPHIAGIASLITSAGVLPTADYAKVDYILKETARPFPTGTGNDCITYNCGAGIVDATAAIAFALDPGSDYSAQYSDVMYEKSEHIYTFDAPEDKVDPTSLWFIDVGKLTSNDINDSQSTSYQMSLENVDLYDINFDWGVSSEENYDFLIFSTENSTTFSASGVAASSFSASGIRAKDGQLDLDWTYVKDINTEYGTDNAWIDNIVIMAYKSTTSFSFSPDVTAKTIRITNNGLDPLSISSVVLSDTTNFALLNTCTVALNYHESCDLTVSYIGSFDTKHTTTLSYDTSDTSNAHIEKVFDDKAFTNIVPIINYLLF